MTLQQAVVGYVIPKSWLRVTARRDGLLSQLSDRQRAAAFEYRGSINSWDEDVPIARQDRAA